VWLDELQRSVANHLTEIGIFMGFRGVDSVFFGEPTLRVYFKGRPGYYGRLQLHYHYPDPYIIVVASLPITAKGPCEQRRFSLPAGLLVAHQLGGQRVLVQKLGDEIAQWAAEAV